MNGRSDEIAMERMAIEEADLRAALNDFKAGNVEIDYIIACIGVIVERAVGEALDDSAE